MRPDQIKTALRNLEGEIIGVKAMGRRSYGTAYNAPRSEWPTALLERLEAMKRQAKEYRRLLAECENVNA